MKTTLVIGASEHPERYSNQAIRSLRSHGHPVIAFGLKPGEVGDVPITNEWNSDWKLDTVSLYLNPKRQIEFYDALVALRPKRVIFNPGTENPELETILETAKIDTEIACTLVLLSIGEY